MKNLSTRTKIIFFCLGLIVLISPFLGGGLVEGFVYELILIMASLALFLTLMVFIVEKKQITFLKQPDIPIFLAIFFLAGIVSSIFSLNKYNSWSELIMWLCGISIFFIFSQIASQKITKYFTWLFIMVGALVSLIGFYLFLTSGSEMDMRLDSVLYNPNSLAGYLISIWPIILVLFFVPNLSKTTKKIIYLLNIILTTSFLLTVSYTGWASIFPIIIFIIIYFRKKIFHKKFILFSLLSIIISLSLVVGLRYYHNPSIEESVAVYKTITAEHADYSGTQRTYFIEIGAELFLNKPITGIGFDNLKLAYQKVQDNIAETPRSTHNFYLDLLIESGLFGLISFVGFILIIIIKYLKTDIKNNLYILGIMLGWLGIIIHGSIEFIWEQKIIMIHFFVLAGLIYNHIANQAKNNQFITKKSKISLIIFLLILSILFVARGTQLALSEYYQTKAEQSRELNYEKSAINYYQKAWDINKNPDFLLQIGVLQNMLYTKKNDVNWLSEMKTTADQLIVTDPNNATSYQLLGRYHQAIGENELAKQQFEKALELSPLILTQIKLDYITTLFDLHEYEKLISEVDDYTYIFNSMQRPGATKIMKLEITMNLTKMLDYQAQSYLALNNVEKAIESYNRCLEENPNYYIAEKALQELK